MNHEEAVAFVSEVLNRGNHVPDWPKDERDLFRDYGAWDSFTARKAKLIRMRAEKIIRALTGDAPAAS